MSNSSSANLSLEQYLDEEQAVDQGNVSKNIGSLPWWVLSSIMHALIIFLFMVITTTPRADDSIQELPLHFDIPMKVVPPEKKIDEQKEQDKTFKEITAEAHAAVPGPVNGEKPFVNLENWEVGDHFESKNDESLYNPDHLIRGQSLDAVTTIPGEGNGTGWEGGGTTGLYGFGAGGAGKGNGNGGSGGFGAYGWRDGGGRRNMVKKGGGSPASESAVDFGLEWLKNHQEADGSWDRIKHGGMNAPEYAGGKGENVGMTGLATLAFLGAGHTEKHGKYAANVRQGVQWLISKQDEKGLFGRASRSQMYRNAIGTMALSEAAGMARVSATQAAAQKALDGLVKCQGPYEAWEYWSAEGKHNENDSSITIWAAMALKSGKISGLRVPGTAFEGVLKWIDHAQDLSGAVPGDYAWKGGRTYYRGTMNAPMGPNGSGYSKQTTSLLTAAGGVIRCFWGQKADHPGIVGPCNILLEEALPGKTRQSDYYGWYYATLLMFQKGGHHWKTWNAAMQPFLLAKQVKGDPKDLGGSWDPEGHHVNVGGRVFATALCVLTLEVYYRYLPMYQQ